MNRKWYPPTEEKTSPWPGTLRDRILLNNGLVLEIWDYSRPLAGDRWLVGMCAQIAIKVSKDFFIDSVLYKLFLEEKKGLVYYRYCKERTFVEEALKEEIFEGLRQEFLKTAINYLQHPKFRDSITKEELKKFKQEILWKKSIEENDQKWERLEKEWENRPL